jgi:hypothetical protein
MPHRGGFTMTKSVLFGAALALTVTAASMAEDVESANYIIQGCRDFAAQKSPKEAPMTIFNRPLCAGIVHGIAFMGEFVKLDLKSKSGT